MEKQQEKLYAYVSQAPTRMLTVKLWTKFHPWPTEKGLRRLIFNSAINGFDKVIIRIGRRVLIDEKAFFEWVKEHAKYIRGEK